jgi:menaquinone-dependent protoporphyrinogen oxidase
MKGCAMKYKKLLITYATMSGSTHEIANVIAGTWSSQGLQVDVLPCRSVANLDDYGAVVLGAALYMFHLHKDAVRFLHRHQKHLGNLPVAVFAGGPYGPNFEADAIEVRKNLKKELAAFSWLQPISVQLVGGRFDPARLRFPYNLIPALKQAPPHDSRNWDEIRTWAVSLMRLLDEPSERAMHRPGECHD